MSDKQILMLPGSNRAGSLTVAALERVGEALRERGFAVTLWNMRARPLPVYEADEPDETAPNVQELRALAQTADGLVLGSPTYHNSYSALVKNALDHLTPSLVQGKPVALVGVNSVQPLDHLRIVVRGLLGVAIPTQLVVGDADFPGGVAAGALEKRVSRLADEMAFFVERLRP